MTFERAASMTRGLAQRNDIRLWFWLAASMPSTSPNGRLGAGRK